MESFGIFSSIDPIPGTQDKKYKSLKKNNFSLQIFF